ncbi:50S ribosomal protein L30 [Phototrophicus methaneseepsis]|uniref:Large ribosomal subunit protein uL30 n=1 Tax=Phototrophicus methaneseepsis TaxID=2710758 RepID=A0A7S8ED89_9CHLR|nr:50S ribosomal protein L30 [Phototrophicus methaneseepsis]QPC84816.1 50S ribosomal protein L30 [Phototrophicus methaneseepsis]
MAEQTANKLKVTLVKSAIGYDQKQKKTVAALGLRKLNTSVVVTDTPVMRGMIAKVGHLVTVEEVAE